MATIKQSFKKRIWECAEKYKPTYQISYMENKDIMETEFTVNSASTAQSELQDFWTDFCKEFDYATGHAIRVDYMKFKPVNNTVSGIEKGDFYCYEVKSSIEDFNSGHGLNFIGDYNYLVMPEEVYVAVSNKIPYFVGVLVPTESSWRNNWRELTVIKKARRRDREKPLSEMLFMMFRSASRDRFKVS